MSEQGKVRRQSQGVKRSDTHIRLAPICRAHLEQLAKHYNTSMAKVLDAILRKKPEPDDFYLR